MTRRDSELRDQYFAAGRDHDAERQRLDRLTAEYDPFSRDCLARALDLAQPDRIIDVGCGTGSLLRWMSDILPAHATLAGLDLEPRTDRAGRARIQTGDLFEPPFTDTFDLVHCRLVLEHLPDPAAGLAALTRLLEPGGYLLVADLDCSVVTASDESHALATDFNRGVTAMLEALESSGLVATAFGNQLADTARALGLDVIEEIRFDREIEGGSDWALFQSDNTAMLNTIADSREQSAGLVRGFQTPGFRYHDQALVYLLARKPG